MCLRGVCSSYAVDWSQFLHCLNWLCTLGCREDWAPVCQQGDVMVSEALLSHHVWQRPWIGDRFNFYADCSVQFIKCEFGLSHHLPQAALVDFTVLSITSLHQGAFSRLLDRCSCTALSLNTDEPCGNLECFLVIRYKLAWHPPPHCKALEASHECLSRHVSHNIKVNCSGDAESKDANPYLVGCSQAKGSGPTKSTPVNENGGSSLNLNSGKGGGGGARHAGPSNLWHTT